MQLPETNIDALNGVQFLQRVSTICHNHIINMYSITIFIRYYESLSQCTYSITYFLQCYRCNVEVESLYISRAAGDARRQLEMFLALAWLTRAAKHESNSRQGGGFGQICGILFSIG